MVTAALAAMTKPLRVVIIDNYDSYVYNLYQRIGELTGVVSSVFRNDRTTLEEIEACEPTHIVISPGPGSPDNETYFGVCARVLRELGPTIPTLGVCLGHQGIGVAFGAKIARAPKPMHGKTSLVRHTGSPLFAGLAAELEVMRYHSLVIDPTSVPESLRVTATTMDGIIMGIDHVTHPIFGVQFHPESIGTPCGVQILANFLAIQHEGNK